MRMIDGEKVEKIFTEWLNSIPAGEETPAIEACLNVVKNMPAITPSNEWVSVEERLPGSHEQVLMWSAKWSIIEAGSYYNGHFWVHNELGDGYIAENITYWMPLPAPPEHRLPNGEMKNGKID